MRRLVFAVLLLVPTVATLGGCFNYDEPVCSFKCGGGTLCPEDYECRSDGYCHTQGSTEVCSFSDASLVSDLSAASNADLSDGATSSQDFSSADSAGTD